jgi:hypothetical protein
MILYKKLLESLKLPEIFYSCALGEVKVPISDYEEGLPWYGFPPALIPILSEGSGPTYLGYWRHWFINRESSFVKMYIDLNRSTFEIARTVEQFMAFIAVESIVSNEDITYDLSVFSDKTGIKNLDEIYSVCLKSGDDPKGLISITQFKEKIPLESITDHHTYDGSFPVEISSEIKKIDTICSFELSRVNNIFSFSNLPNWLSSGYKKDKLFEDYLSKNEIASAWLTLNSTGWSISDAKKALIELKNKVKDERFDLLVSFWTSLADESAGNY